VPEQVSAKRGSPQLIGPHELQSIASCGHTKGVVCNLFVMHADGSGAERLTNGTADTELPAWRGDTIYFCANVAGTFDVWRVHFCGRLVGHGRVTAPGA
jgi:Tol biopolymer transport system component